MSRYPLLVLMLISLSGLFACSPEEPDTAEPPQNIELNSRQVELNVRLADLFEQLELSKQQTRDARETILNLQQQIAQLEQENQPDLSVRLEDLTEQLALSKQQTGDARATILNLQQQIAQSEQENQSDLNARLEDLTAQLALSNQQTSDARAAILNLQQQIAQSKQENQSELDQLHQQISQAQADKKALEQKLQDYLNQEENNLKLLADKEKKLQQTATKLIESQKNHATAQSEISTFQQQLDETKILMQTMLGEQQRLDSELETSEQALLAAQKKANDINLNYRDMLAKNSSLERNDGNSRKQLNELRQELESTQENIAHLTQARGIYTVQPDDNLSKIAAFFYRDGNQWTDIWKANQFLLNKPDLIYTGMVLVIPHADQIN